MHGGNLARVFELATENFPLLKKKVEDIGSDHLGVGITCSVIGG